MVATNDLGGITAYAAAVAGGYAGTRIEFEASLANVGGKADKKVPSAAGNFAALGANGNLADSGHKHSDYEPSTHNTSSTAHSALFAAKADKSTIVTATLQAASWVGEEAPFTYTLAVPGVTTTSNQEILPALDITQEQLEALQGANIVDGGQASGSITLKAWGEVPTVDIPVRIIKRGDM